MQRQLFADRDCPSAGWRFQLQRQRPAAVFRYCLVRAEGSDCAAGTAQPWPEFVNPPEIPLPLLKKKRRAFGRGKTDARGCREGAAAYHWPVCQSKQQRSRTGKPGRAACAAIDDHALCLQRPSRAGAVGGWGAGQPQSADCARKVPKRARDRTIQTRFWTAGRRGPIRLSGRPAARSELPRQRGRFSDWQAPA